MTCQNLLPSCKSPADHRAPRGPSLEITIAIVAFHFKELNKYLDFPLPPKLELSCTLLKPQILFSSFPLVLSIWAGIENNLLTYLEASEGREYLSPWGTNWLKQFADRTLEESQLLHEMPSLVFLPCLPNSLDITSHSPSPSSAYTWDQQRHSASTFPADLSNLPDCILLPPPHHQDILPDHSFYQACHSFFLQFYHSSD